jgi:hypothetical protein
METVQKKKERMRKPGRADGGKANDLKEIYLIAAAFFLQIFIHFHSYETFT